MAMEVSIGMLITIVIYIFVVLTAIFGGLFIRGVSGKQVKFHEIGKKVLRVFFAWILPPWKLALKVLVVVALLTAGIVLIGTSPKVSIYTIQTGKGYTLQEQPQLWPVIGQATGEPPLYYWTYRYALNEYPIYTTIRDWWLEPGQFIVGLALIIISLYIAAFFMVKANNAIYLTKAEEK